MKAFKSFVGRMAAQWRRYRMPLSWIGILSVTLLSFQNCSDVQFQTLQNQSLLVPNGLLRINGGAPYTNNQTARLTVESFDAESMAFQNDVCPDEATADWKPYNISHEWLLADSDGRRVVHALLKSADGAVSDCIQAEVVLDRQAPTIEQLAVPTKVSNSAQAAFRVEPKDETSGVAALYCLVTGNTNASVCPKEVTVDDLDDGAKSMMIVAVDRAGNQSEPFDYSWLVDLTAPTVSIVEPLVPALSVVNAVSVHFEGADPNGSGVQSYSCMLNNQAIADCSSPQLLSNLADGNYIFRVKALDGAGWESAVAEHAFLVDTKTSEAFNILGVAGGNDAKVDGYLTDLAMPAVHWSVSMGAQSYSLTILDAAKSPVCGPYMANGNETSALLANCPLADGATYFARMVAYRNTLERGTDDFAFLVDVTAPSIQILNLVKVDEEKKARIEFAVTDSASGVQTAVCYKTFKMDVKQDDCVAKTFIEYVNLVEGEHVFHIAATDKAGNAAESAPLAFTMEYVVCDPFKLVEGKCQKGLKARIYYASSADRAQGNTFLRDKFDRVGKLIDEGVRSNAILYLPFLDVRARLFTDGFTTTANNQLKDDDGKILDEWFALDMETVIKLGPGDSDGYYQFMLVSDDGSVLYLDPNNNNQFRKVIDNDGTHSTRVGCSQVGDVVQLNQASRLPARVQYYQGPRTQIAMSMFWRRVNNPNAPHSAHCNRSDGGGGWGFGSPENYQLLINEGFKPLGETNFILNEVLQ